MIKTFGESVEAMYPRVVHRQMMAFRRQLEDRVEKNIKLISDYQRHSLVRVESDQLVDDELMHMYAIVQDEYQSLLDLYGNQSSIPPSTDVDDYLKFLLSVSHATKTDELFKHVTPVSNPLATQSPEEVDRQMSKDMLTVPHLLHVLIELAAQTQYKNFPISIANPSNVRAIFNSMSVNVTKYITEMNGRFTTE